MRESRDKEDAIKIVEKGENFLNSVNEERAWKLGSLWFFDKKEYEEATAIRDLVKAYLANDEPKRPLSIAVFGPPGSGKSFAVRQIQQEMSEYFKDDLHLSYDEINLTQIATPTELFGAVKEVYKSNLVANRVSRRDAVPFVFFDEFDAPCTGVPLGWLNWFLAPMQDSAIGHGEGKIELKKAVYFFAGGTAPTLSEFSAVHSREFVNAKGPDFVSRLRGYLNIRGPNDETRTCSRRALVIRTALGSMEKKPDPYPNKDLLERIFNEGRFKHGSRSISVLLEMAAGRALERRAENNGTDRITWDDLPPAHILSIHADQGPLDADTIGGLIGISVGRDAQEDNKASASKVAQDIIGRLWQLGATIGYGGRWDRDLTQTLVSESHRLRRPTATEEKRVEVFSREDKEQQLEDKDVVIVPVPSRWRASSESSGQSFIGDWAAAFRMRWTMSCRSVARILISGKLTGFSGRMPGVLEEAILALALKQPVYVLGGFGGAATLVGELLGLATGNAATSVGDWSIDDWTNDSSDVVISSYSSVFQPVVGTQLPLTSTDALDYISLHAIGGPYWQNNGLSVDENRRLFRSKDLDEIGGLVSRGLLRKFGYYAV